MTYVFIKVDFDRDAAFPIKNLRHAVSKPLHKSQKDVIESPEKSVSVHGTKAAFELFMNYLIDKMLPTTFYFEARSLEKFCNNYPEQCKNFNHTFFEIGLHGYDHEDLTGEETGIILSQEEEQKTITNAKKKVEQILKKQIRGFRAPYMKISDNTLNILSDLGFLHDSSTYRESTQGISPYTSNSNIWEFPVIKTPKSSKMKGMYTYLWPLFEGKRKREEVIKNFLILIENTKNPKNFVSINLHSWHFAYSVTENKFLNKDDIKENFNAFKKLVESLEKNENVTFSLPKKWIEKNK